MAAWVWCAGNLGVVCGSGSNYCRQWKGLSGNVGRCVKWMCAHMCFASWSLFRRTIKCTNAICAQYMVLLAL